VVAAYGTVDTAVAATKDSELQSMRHESERINRPAPLHLGLRDGRICRSLAASMRPEWSTAAKTDGPFPPSATTTSSPRIAAADLVCFRDALVTTRLLLVRDRRPAATPESFNLQALEGMT
jgi:hypothetical protein